MKGLETLTYRDQLVVPLVYTTEQFTPIYTQEFLKVWNADGNHIRVAIE
jgi:hypothetical protein